MGLRDWHENSWLKKVKPTPDGVGNLVGIADREIADASLGGMSDSGRYEHAYNAARSLCEAVLHATGYEVPKGTTKHQRLIESLKFTIGTEVEESIDYLDQCRRLRHRVVYDERDAISTTEADKLLGAATELRKTVGKWLTDHHPNLFSE